MNRSLLVLAVGSILLYSCTSTSVLPKYELGSDYYTLSQRGTKPQKVFVEISEDSVNVIAVNKSQLQVDPSKDKFFTKPSFDADIMVTLFKYRTATGNLPRQLTTDFSGNLFLGYRVDRFRVRHLQTPAGRIKVGMGLGRDYLTDRDKDIWIYQNQTWYGLTFSVNLN